MLYQLPALDSQGDVRLFEKPLFLVFLMFVAMAAALPIYYIQQVWARWWLRRSMGSTSPPLAPLMGEFVWVYNSAGTIRQGAKAGTDAKVLETLAET